MQNQEVYVRIRFLKKGEKKIVFHQVTREHGTTYYFREGKVWYERASNKWFCLRNGEVIKSRNLLNIWLMKPVRVVPLHTQARVDMTNTSVINFCEKCRSSDNCK